jgi:hypothetical protein
MILQIYGERNSGTKWLADLLWKNLEIGPRHNQISPETFFNPRKPGDMSHISFSNYGYKHYFVPEFVRKKDTTKDLFIVISRNPYDWLVSMCEHPWHADSTLHGLQLSRFIQKEWRCTYDQTYYNVDPKSGKLIVCIDHKSLKKLSVTLFGNLLRAKDRLQNLEHFSGKEIMHERDPKTGRRFKNILELRKAKYRDWLGLESHVNHFYFVRYEDLLVSPMEFLTELSDKFKLKLKKYPKCDLLYKSPYEIGSSDLESINKLLDFRLEKSLGYTKKLSQEELRRSDWFDKAVFSADDVPSLYGKVEFIKDNDRKLKTNDTVVRFRSGGWVQKAITIPEHGYQILKLVNGKKNVREILKSAGQSKRLDPLSNDAILKFLNGLHEKGLLARIVYRKG